MIESKLTTEQCTCRLCGADFPAQIDKELMARVGLSKMVPSVCDDCAPALHAQAEQVSQQTTLASTQADLVPFQDWDDRKGNLLTMNTIAAAIRQQGDTGVLIHGDTGKGKTRALCVQALAHLAAGDQVRWREATQVGDRFSVLEGSAPQQMDAYKGSFLTYPILCLDDFGKGKMTEHRQACWFDVFDRLVKAGTVQVWVTTNKTPDQLTTWLGDYGRTIMQRISDLCSWVEV